MSPRTLIFLGKGATADTVDEYCAAYPDADLWTLNQATHPCSRLHFDVRYDQRFWPLLDSMSCDSIVSPFLQRSGSQSFPLALLHETFGHAYLESTICYMAAYAALQQATGSARWDRLCLPGCDMADAMHFAYRFGLHFWLGVLLGQGARIDLPAGSYVLQRKPSIAVGPTEVNYPHIYGQPRSQTEPLVKRYGWPLTTH